MFPVEIWEEILKNLDAVSLSKLRNVCRMFNSCINRILATKHSWYWQCKEDIPEKYWLILHEKSSNLKLLMSCASSETFEKEEENHKLWKTMYRVWVKWSNIEKYSTETETIQINFKYGKLEFVTCTDILGTLLAFGTSNGSVRLYNIDTKRFIYKGDQCEYVKDIHIIMIDEQIQLLTLSNLNTTRLWNLTSDKCIKKGKGNMICGGYGMYCTILDHIVSINSRYPALKTRSNILLATMGYKKVYMWLECGRLFELDICDGLFSSTYEMSNEFIENNLRIKKLPTYRFRQIRIFNPDVIICITECGNLGISVKNSKWQMYNAFQFLEADITAVFFHVRVLALGLSIGQIYLFFVDNEDGLKSLNLRSKKSKKIQVCKEDIISIHLAEVNGNHHLLAASRSGIHIVNFV